MTAAGGFRSLAQANGPFVVGKLDHRLDLFEKSGVKPATTGKSGRLRGSYAMLTTLSEAPSDWAYFLAANYGVGRYKVSDRANSWRFHVDEELASRAKLLADRSGRENGWGAGLFLAPGAERRQNPASDEKRGAGGATGVEARFDELRSELRAMFQAMRDDMMASADDEDDDDEPTERSQNPADALRGAINLVAEAKAAWGEQEKPSFDWSVVIDGLARVMSARAPSPQGSLPLGPPAQNPAATPHAEQWGIIISALESAGITPDVAASMVLPHLQGMAPAAPKTETAPVAP